MSILASDLFAGGRVSSSRLFPDNPTITTGSASGTGSIVNVGSPSSPVSGSFYIFVPTNGGSSEFTIVVDGKTISGAWDNIEFAFIGDYSTLNNVYTYPVIRFDTSLSVTVDTFTGNNMNWNLTRS